MKGLKKNARRFSAISLAVLFVVLTGFSSMLVTRPEAYLKTGNAIRFTWIYDSGAKRVSVTEIKSATTVNGTTLIIAKSTAYDDNGRMVFTYNYRFWSDTVNWCVDPLNYMFVYDAQSSEQTIETDCDSLVYPLSMKAGDTLPTALGRKWNGGKSASISESQFIYNRKVVKLDTIKTGMGEMAAFRIEAKVRIQSSTDLGKMGKTSSDETNTSTEWFNPQYGVVMSERTGKYGTTRIVISK